MKFYKTYIHIFVVVKELLLNLRFSEIRKLSLPKSRAGAAQARDYENTNYIFLYNVQLGKLKLAIYNIFISIKQIIIYYYNFVCNKFTLLFITPGVILGQGKLSSKDALDKLRLCIQSTGESVGLCIINSKSFYCANGARRACIGFNILFSWFKIFIRIIIYMGIFILITTNTPIYINMEVWTNIAQFVLMKIGLIKVKLISCNNVIVLANYRSIYGIKSYIILYAIWCIIVSGLFILCNIHYIILNILGIIWTKAFLINFYEKHLSPFAFILGGKSTLNSNTGESNSSSINEWMQYILNNRVVYMHFMLKLILTTWLIVIILRCLVWTLFNGAEALDDNFILNGLVILLPLPICSYLVNFVTKKIKKETITSKDYYLYNEFVVDSVNLYRMTFILCINYVVRNYYYIYYGTIIVLILLLLIILFIYYIFYIRPNTLSERGLSSHGPAATENQQTCMLRTAQHSADSSDVGMHASHSTAHRELSGNKRIMLESNTGDVIAMVTAFVGIAPILQDACNTGYDKFINHRGRGAGHLYWKKLPFANPGEYCIGKAEAPNRTVNFLWKKDPLYVLQKRAEDIQLFTEEKLKLKQSPILNMTYLLKNNEATLRSPYKWQIRPISFFNNEKFNGSISQSGIGKFLIIILIRKDLNKVCTFIPSFYLPDNTVEGQQRIRDIVDLLEVKYNIHIPKGSLRKNGLMLFTQAESISDNGLVRLWRPSLAYTDPEVIRRETRVRDYYKLDNSELTRLDDFNYKGAIDLIKNLVVKNSIENLKEDEAIEHMKELITNEVIADRICRSMLTKFICWGENMSAPGEYINQEETIRAEGEYNPDKYTVEGLIQDVDDRRKDQIRRLQKGKSKVLTPLEELDKVLETYTLSGLSNHVSFNSNDQTLYARRNIAIDWSITKWDLSSRAYFSIAQQGVIEGFKTTSQALGLLNQEFHFPLHEGRQEIVTSIAERYNSGNPANVAIDSICAVSVNRLTFEFMEVRPDSNVFGYLLADGRDHPYNCEIFSLIDTENHSSLFPTILNTGSEDKILPKHDYHFLDDKDEHSIRKFMDYIYKNDDGNLNYKSNISNEDILEGVIDIETLENIMEHFDLNNKARRIRVFKVGEQSSDNKQLIKRVYKWIFKPTQIADFGLLKKTVLDEWEDEVIPGDMGPRNPLPKSWTRKAKGERMVPKEFTIGRRLIELDREAAQRRVEAGHNAHIRSLKAIEKKVLSELSIKRGDVNMAPLIEDNVIKKEIEALERIVEESSRKRKRG